MPSLSIASRATPDATVIALTGDLDSESVQRFEDAVARAEGHRIIVDLRRVESMDSFGLSSIVRAANAAASRDGLQVIPGPKSVDYLFDLTVTRSRVQFVEHAVVDGPFAELWLG
jgi:anti-anti-sigma factor